MVPQTVLDYGGKGVDKQEQNLRTQGSLRTICEQFAATLPSAVLKSNQHSADSGNSVLYRQQTAVPPQEQAMFANHDAQCEVIAMQNHQNHVGCVDFHSNLHSQTVRKTTPNFLGEQLPRAFFPATHESLGDAMQRPVFCSWHSPDGVDSELRTVMIGGIPFEYNLHEFVHELCRLGCPHDAVNFVYLSMGKRGTNRGFAIVNFVDPAMAECCFGHVAGHLWSRYQLQQKKAAVVWWAATQGLRRNLRQHAAASKRKYLITDITCFFYAGLAGESSNVALDRHLPR